MGIDDSGLYADIVDRTADMEKLIGEAYADDLTIIFQMSMESVAVILQILRNK
jgi:hypothetical protein